MSAGYEDAAAGWEIYKQYRGELTRVELNEALRVRGFRLIAPRTFSHYQKLARLGYDEYVSINRLDLKHATSSVFDIADRSRYSDRELDVSAALLVPTQSEVERFAGKVIRVSEGFASFLTPASQSASAIGRAQIYNRGVLVFERVRVERAVEVYESAEVDGFVRMQLVFRSLLETDLLFPDLVGATSVRRIQVPLGDDPSLYAVMTVFRRYFDLYESLRGFADLYAAAALPDHRPVLANPRVHHLKVDSPFELDLAGSPLVWPLVAVMVRIVVPLVISSVRDVQRLRHATAEEGRSAERHPLELEALQLRNLKGRIEVGQLIEELEPALRERFGPGVLLGDVEPSTERLEALKNQAVEATVEIALESKGDVELHHPAQFRDGGEQVDGRGRWTGE